MDPNKLKGLSCSQTIRTMQSFEEYEDIDKPVAFVKPVF